MSTNRQRRLPVMAIFSFGLLGAGLAAQINYQRQLAAAPRVEEARLDTLLRLYAAQQQENEQLQARLDRLNSQLLQIRNASAGRNMELIEQRAAAMAQYSGLAPVQGPGIRVEIHDSTQPVETEFDQNPYTVHDQDLLLVVNELWAAGAEAIALGGQRLVTDSEIRCSGPVINVNGAGLTPPFVIDAIGDGRTLAGALADLRGGIVDQLRNVGIEVKITKLEQLLLPALAREPSFRFARPATARKEP
ncbi:MAG: DUF881 domain-containing protein [Gammaproteobacteria bacterium]|nr:DUF881 domain-containing protein [Gammaproteobacteria bacterium]